MQQQIYCRDSEIYMYVCQYTVLHMSGTYVTSVCIYTRTESSTAVRCSMMHADKIKAAALAITTRPLSCLTTLTHQNKAHTYTYYN